MDAVEKFKKTLELVVEAKKNVEECLESDNLILSECEEQWLHESISHIEKVYDLIGIFVE